MKIFLTKEAEKQYRRLNSSNRNKVYKKIQLLQQEPFSGKKLTGEYRNLRSLKAWPYRIIYLINDKNKELLIVSVIHRQGAYK